MGGVFFVKVDNGGCFCKKSGKWGGVFCKSGKWGVYVKQTFPQRTVHYVQ